MKIKNIIKIALSALIFSTSMHAQATTYTNVGKTPVIPLGYLSTGKGVVSIYGQTFTTSGGILQDFTFYGNSGQTGNVGLVISAWDGSKAVGPALYRSSPISFNGETTLGATDINLELQANASYIAYLTTIDIPNATRSMVFLGTYDDGGASGKFVYSRSEVDPLLTNGPWGTWGNNDRVNFVYTANVTDIISAVPEPETYAMLLAGLCLIGFTIQRKVKKT